MTDTWSGSWADDGGEDLGPPPPAAITEPSPPQKKSYAATLESSPEPAHIERIIQPAPTRTQRPVKQSSTPQQFPREAWGVVKTQMRASVSASSVTEKQAPRIVKVSASYQEFATVSVPQKRIPVRKPVEVKCDKCHEARGYLKFTERHVEGQIRESPNRLDVGTYCLACVTLIAPRCSKEDCQNRTTICLPDARWPFSLFCQSCMTAHKLASRT